MMHRKPARRDQKQIITRKQTTKTLMPGHPQAGRADDALPLARPQRFFGFIKSAPRLYLNEDQSLALLRHQIDLAGRSPGPVFQQAITLQRQEKIMGVF